MADRKRWYYFLKDDYDSILMNKNAWRDPVLKGISYAKTGQPAEAEKIEIHLSAYQYLITLSTWIFCRLGEKLKAMEYLHLAYRLYDYNLVKIKVDKLFDPLKMMKNSGNC